MRAALQTANSSTSLLGSQFWSVVLTIEILTHQLTYVIPAQVSSGVGPCHSAELTGIPGSLNC